MPFVPNSDQDKKEMLDAIGVKNFEELISAIPESVRPQEEIVLPRQLSEYEIEKLLKQYSAKNISADSHICFMGGGSYDRFIPAIVPEMLSRPEFRTAYTPYQAEVSQGTLQAMYEFQSMICELTKMEVSNASLYDAGSSLAEACLLAHAQNKLKKFIIVGSIHPNYLKVTKTICDGRGLEFEIIKDSETGAANIDKLREAMADDVSAVIVQHPNFLGNLEDVFEIEKTAHSTKKGMLITIIEPISLGLIEPPGNFNADIVVGEGQPLGIPMSYGGPYLGIFACKQKYIRKLPGRIAGMTEDENGNPGFVLTLQTREQQIKREKATSNICTNQGLFMLAATVYMEVMGRQGIKEVAENSYHNAHYLADKIAKIDGFSLLNDLPFVFEFAVKTPVDPEEIIVKGVEKGFLAGLNTKILTKDTNNALLISVTEKRNKEEMDSYIDFLSEFSA